MGEKGDVENLQESKINRQHNLKQHKVRNQIKHQWEVHNLRLQKIRATDYETYRNTHFWAKRYFRPEYTSHNADSLAVRQRSSPSIHYDSM